MSTYRTIEAPVAAGDMCVGLWEPEEDGGDAATTVLLIHGVTASHLSWPVLASRLPDACLIAPDLRGRGHSNELVGPAGLDAHARDMVAVLDALGIEKTVVVGHSMGAFVALALGELYPDRVSRVVLVDGGLPLDLPVGLSPEQTIRLVLGPAADRLAMRFESVDAYFVFWRGHPAFRRDWSPALEAYLAYDLTGEAPELRPSTSYERLEEDSIDQNTGTTIVNALRNLRHPSVLLTAERGLFDQLPALYAEERLPALLAAHPGVKHHRVPDVNHYTITMSERGADAVAAVVREELASLDR